MEIVTIAAKTCSQCKLEKALDKFWRQYSGKYGRVSRCKECLSEENITRCRNRYNRDIIKSRKEVNDSYYKHHIKRILNWRKLKVEVIAAYGNKCECCNEVNIEFLTIDHIKGDGAIHAAKVGRGTAIYQDLKKRNYPQEGYRILCGNCNSAYGHYGYCPHKVSNDFLTYYKGVIK